MNDLAKALPLPRLNCDLITKTISTIVKDEVQKIELNHLVLGVSGGIDSALSLAVAVEAIGPENVTAVLMPYKLSSENSLTDAKELCKKYRVAHETIEITSMADPYFSLDSEIENLRKGNVLARLRMMVLYDYSSKKKGLVLGTSNKSEILIGYSTLWGDMASAINPIGDLYKYQVYDLSRHLGIIDEILNKTPSADLWEGQSDEQELNLTYDFLDRVLYHWVDLCWSKARIIDRLNEFKIGDAEKKVERVIKLISRSQFKRKMPLIAKVSNRTVNREFRFPRDWNA